MEMILIGVLFGFVGGTIGGYILATHIHSLTSAVSRATTIHVAAPVDKAIADVGADVNKVIENASRQTL